MREPRNMLATSPRLFSPRPVPRERILIIEDDPNTRWVLKALLTRAGYDCRTASDGSEGLVMASEFHPSAILMDVMMPVLDGLETTRRLKADVETAGIPVVMMTADITHSGEIAARNAGCDAFLAKPVVLKELLHELESRLSE